MIDPVEEAAVEVYKLYLETKRNSYPTWIEFAGFMFKAGVDYQKGVENAVTQCSKEYLG